MRTVFGIDVSKATSEVAILVNGERVQSYSISNDIKVPILFFFINFLSFLYLLHKISISNNSGAIL